MLRVGFNDGSSKPLEPPEMFIFGVGVGRSRLSSGLGRRAFAGIEGKRIWVLNVGLILLPCNSRSWLWLPRSRAGSPAWRRRRWRDFVFEVVKSFGRIGVFRVGGFHSGEGNFFCAASWQVNFDSRLSPGFYAVRADEWLG